MFKSSFSLIKNISLAPLQSHTILQRITPGLQDVLLKHFHVTSFNRGKSADLSLMRRQAGKKEDGTDGERALNLDVFDGNQMFPDITTADKVFNGIPFKYLPICNIKTTPNNTIFNVTDYKGRTKAVYSCGIEGFKNCKKGTNVAAQSTGITFGKKVLNIGYKTVRVRIQGLGPGRLSSIRGLEIAGLNIISVTDATRVSDNPPRPRSARRI